MSSTVAAWISGSEIETRSSGTPRIRSASMPLLGFEETRIRRSSRCCGVATDLLRPLGTERTDRACQTVPKAIRRGVSAEPLDHELAQFALDAHASLAVGAQIEVSLEILLLLIGERSIEEKVND